MNDDELRRTGVLSANDSTPQFRVTPNGQPITFHPMRVPTAPDVRSTWERVEFTRRQLQTSVKRLAFRRVAW